MPKTAFHTLLGEESELKQHAGVFKPETSSAPEQNAAVCRPFEGQTALLHKRRFKTSSVFSETNTAINSQFHCKDAYLLL